MTALLMPAPGAETYRQLGFTWEDSFRDDATNKPAVSSEPQTSTIEDQATPQQVTKQGLEDTATDGILRFREDTETGGKRIAEPVRIGGVMIKLLKRYGITDAEIAEGLENYAAKQGRLAAS